MACILTERDLAAVGKLANRLRAKGLVAESDRLLEILRQGTARREVRASTAARILRVTPQTIRNWVRRGLLAGRVDRTGHVLVPAYALEDVARLDAVLLALPNPPADVTEDDILAEIAAHRAERKAKRG